MSETHAEPDIGAVLPSPVTLERGAPPPALVTTPLPEGLAEGIQEHLANASARNTVRAYRSDWASFERWCTEHSQPALPAAPAVVAAYITDRAALRKPNGDFTYAPSTIARWVTSINIRHQEANLPAPGETMAVKRVMAGIRRGHVRPTRRMAPVLLDDLRKALTAVDLNSYPDGIIGHRDHALLVLGFAGAFRRSELASRTVGDVMVHPEDGLHVRLLTSKTDQEGRGAVKGLPYGQNPLTCPPCAYLRWIRVLAASETGPRSDLMRVLMRASADVHICRAAVPKLEGLDPKAPLFRPVRRGGHVGAQQISGEVVNDVVKRRLGAVGLDPRRFGGHSLRAGFVTQALRAGATPAEVMRQTGHRNPATVEIYRREHDPLRQNAVTRVGL